MAIIVVAIHTNPQNGIDSESVKYIIKKLYFLAVPFFFSASGFLIWRGIKDATKEEKLARLNKWVRKTFKLYIIWTCIYLPFTIYEFSVLKTHGIVKSILIFGKNLILIGENYMSWPLWYLLATIVAGIMIYGMVKCNFRMRTMYGIAIVFAFGGVMMEYFMTHEGYESITFLYSQVFRNTRNGFFQGLPCIMIGMAIAQHGVIRSNKLLSGLFLLSLAAFVVNINIAKFIATYALLSLVLCSDSHSYQDDVYKKLRLTSTVTYFSHMLFVGVIAILWPEIPGTIQFIIAISGCIILANLVILYKEKSWVKLLFK